MPIPSLASEGSQPPFTAYAVEMKLNFVAGAVRFVLTEGVTLLLVQLGFNRRHWRHTRCFHRQEAPETCALQVLAPAINNISGTNGQAPLPSTCSVTNVTARSSRMTPEGHLGH